MPTCDIDYLIIGQGLAGSALAWHLIQAGQRVRVIDDGHRSAASRVAAGLVNPLAGMRFNRRPELADWLRSAQAWYDELAPLCGRPLFYRRPMLRLFRSAEQRRFHQRRLVDPEADGLLGVAFAARDCPEQVAAPFGGFVQQHTGYVDIPLLLARLRDWLRAQDSLITEAIAFDALESTAAGVRMAHGCARHVVFCEGARLIDNPWFNTLPLEPDRGEILTLSSESWRPRHIINGAHWLLPLASDELRFGATHDHQTLDGGVTEAARQALLDGLHALAPDHRFAVIDQQAGVRPATQDRYPLVGRHPTQRSLWVCNGFGARGALSIPWYTERLARHLTNGQPLPAEADIRRFARTARDG